MSAQIAISYPCTTSSLNARNAKPTQYAKPVFGSYNKPLKGKNSRQDNNKLKNH
jgi:hypothetical protein